jgi:hypothetical protein
MEKADMSEESKKSLADLKVGDKVFVHVNTSKYISRVAGQTQDYLLVECNGIRRFNKLSGVIERGDDIKIRSDIRISALTAQEERQSEIDDERRRIDSINQEKSNA